MSAGARDTIAAIATATGPAGVAIVRISGPEAHRIARIVCPDLPEVPRARYLYHRDFVDGEGQILDRGLVALFRAPHSMTGEDVAELHGHGGRLAATALLRRVLEAGARLARPGEFSRRAVEAGKMDLAQAEGIAAMVAAGSEAALRAARAVMGGTLSRRLETLSGEIEALLAEWEACLDFPDETGEVDEAGWARRLERLTEAVAALAETWKVGRRVAGVPRIVLLGPPNAGKSSLFNALVGWEKAIVDAAPGTTRDPVEARLFLGEVEVELVDGAGLREAAGPVERQGIARTEEAATGAMAVVLVFDGHAAPPADWRHWRERYAPALWVLGKADLGLSEAWAAALAQRLPERGEALRVSARTGRGVEALRARLREAVEAALPDAGFTGLCLERHYDGVRAAAEALAAAGEALAGGAALDAACEGLREARGALDEVLGRTLLPDETLDRIFARFCIGK